MWQSGHARVGLGGMTKFALLVVASAAVILSKFSLSTLLHAFKYLASLYSQALSDSLKFSVFRLTSRSFVINSPYESLKFAEKFSLSGLPFLIAEELKAEESYPIGFSLGGRPQVVVENEGNFLFLTPFCMSIFICQQPDFLLRFMVQGVA